MKKSLVFLGILFVSGFSLLAAQDNPALDAIVNHFGARNYAAGQVTGAELDLIIRAGLRAPSANNRQPWYFTVVRDSALVKQIVSQAAEGNVLIVVSAQGDKTNGALFLDCGLAVQSIYLAAQALGLGSRIYTGPIDALNSRFKTQLGLPANRSAVALVRIGRLPPGTDAVSSASSRSAADRKVTYK